MSEKVELKSIVVWTILGFICVLMMRYIEQFLVIVTKIICSLLHLDSITYFFMDLIPQLLIIVFWILLFFKYLKGFRGELKIEKFPRKFAINISFITLVFFLLSVGFNIVNDYGWSLYDNYSFSEIGVGIIKIKTIAVAGLNFIELIVFIVGFLIITRNITHNDNI